MTPKIIQCFVWKKNLKSDPFYEHSIQEKIPLNFLIVLYSKSESFGNFSWFNNTYWILCVLQNPQKKIQQKYSNNSSVKMKLNLQQARSYHSLQSCHRIKHYFLIKLMNRNHFNCGKSTISVERPLSSTATFFLIVCRVLGWFLLFDKLLRVFGWFAKTR